MKASAKLNQGCTVVSGTRAAHERCRQSQNGSGYYAGWQVKSIRTIGGHPLLVQACQDAVKDWKFLPASEETTQIVEFDFHGTN